MRFVHIPYSDEKALSSFLSCKSYSEAILKANICGYSGIDPQEEFEKLSIKDFILVRFKDKVVPFQILKKNNESRSLEILSYYILEHIRFDEKTNIWKDSKIRKYLNSDFLKDFDDDFLSHLKEKEVHTEDYVTKDRVWLLSHEEVNCEKSKCTWFKHNKNCFAYSAFSDASSRKRMFLDGNPSCWWLRSACYDFSNSVGFVYGSSDVYSIFVDGSILGCLLSFLIS